MGVISWLCGSENNTPTEKPKELPMYNEEIFIIKDKTTMEINKGYESYYFMSDKNKGYQLFPSNFIQNIFTWKNSKIGDTICVKTYIRGQNSGRTSFEIMESD